MSLLEELLQRRRSTIAELRKLQPELMKTFDQIEDAILGIEVNLSGQIYKEMEAGDAIVHYLTEVDHACDRETIVKAVVARGFKPEATREFAASTVRKAITHWVKPIKDKRINIKEIRELIGLSEWKEDKFREPKK